MELYELQKGELLAALDLVWEVFLEFDAPDYSKQGVDEFQKFILYDSTIQSFEKGELILWGCKTNDELAGVVAIRGTNHICMLFVKNAYHRLGIGRALVQTVEEHCKTHSINKITVNSSPYAYEFYHRLGFVDTGQEQTVNGIRYTPMAYLLS